MKTMLLIAGVAAVGLTAGVSQAATHHHARHHRGLASAGVYAEPKEPIAYNQLSAYLKASPRQRASNDWGGQMAATTGANVNASATTAAPPPADATAAPPAADTTTMPPAADTTQPNAAAAPAATPAPAATAEPSAAPSAQPATPQPSDSSPPATQPQPPQ